PTWTAPANGTGAAQTCSIQVVVNDGANGLTQTASFNQVVSNGAEHTLTITQAPAGTPNPAASGGTVNLTITVVDSLGHALNYSWAALCSTLGGGGSLNNSHAAAPTWTAPNNNTGSQQLCGLQVSIDDGANGLSQSASFNYIVDPAGANHTLTI